MTDNVSITEGSGDKVIATDDVGGVQYQIVKLGYGDDGAATVVSTGASAVPIKDGGNSITVDFTTGSKAQIDDLTTAHKIRIKSTASQAVTLTTASKVQVDDLTTASLVRVQSTGGFAVTLTTASKVVTEFAAAQAVTLTTASIVIADVSTMGLALETGGILDDINSATSAAADSLAVLEAGVIEPGVDATPSLDVISVGGSLLHDSTDAGAPIKIGARSVAGLSATTLVAAADRTNVYAGLDGALYTRPHCGLEDLVKGTTTISASTVAVTCLASVASIKQYVTHVSATNTSTQNAVVGLIDATTPAIMSWACPANYSGFISNFAVPLAPAAAGTKWALQTDTSLATVICNMAGFKSKI
jgi:hypothetical protein